VIDKRVSDNRALARRRWVFRMASFVSITAVILCFIVAWRRDAMVVDIHVRELSKPVESLQATFAEIGRLPAEVPELRNMRLAYYASDAERYYALHTDEPVILAALPTTSLLIWEDGRAIILYHQGEFRAEWMPGSTYGPKRWQQEQAVETFQRERSEQPIILP
jgi:hypothetical protein